MHNIKKAILALTVATVVLGMTAIPAFAASSDWSFTMANRVVDGKANGMYHSLSSNVTPKLSGSIKQTEMQPGVVASDPVATVKVSLQRPRLILADYEYGTLSLGKAPTDGSSLSVSGIFNTTDEASDEYYMLIWKVEIDGRTVSGSGKLNS